MSTDETRQAIESILMVADQPVAPSVLAQLLEVPKSDIEQACADLAGEYREQGRGFVLCEVAGGYRFQSHPDLASYVERFVLEGQSSRLSSAALETLAIVAYKQPMSRMQIAAIRGVNVDGVLRTLQQRGYVIEVSRDPGPGNAVLFGTTAQFLERVGLNSLADLPPLLDFVPGADVVEALEHGLRPDSTDLTAAIAAQPASPDLGESIAAAIDPEEDVVVDLVDAAEDPAPDEAAPTVSALTEPPSGRTEPGLEPEPMVTFRTSLGNGGTRLGDPADMEVSEESGSIGRGGQALAPQASSDRETPGC